MKKCNKILLILIIFTVTLFGCTNHNNVNYSFDDPEIVAYIDGEPMYGLYGLNKNDYIEMKTAWMKSVVTDYGNVAFPIKKDIIGESYHNLIDISRKVYYSESAKKYLEMSDYEKTVDYYVVLKLYSELYITLPQDEETKKYREEYVDEYIEGIKKADEINELSVYIDELANNYNISFNEALERFLKPFILVYDIDFILIPPEDFITKKFKGEIVKENEEYYIIDITENNYEEIYNYLESYRRFSLELREQYIAYMAKIFEDSEIVEKPKDE